MHSKPIGPDDTEITKEKERTDSSLPWTKVMHVGDIRTFQPRCMILIEKQSFKQENEKKKKTNDQLRASLGVQWFVAETSNQETKHHTQRVGELRFITPAGPEELTVQSLSRTPDKGVIEFL